jgi:hypothetical protein
MTTNLRRMHLRTFAEFLQLIERILFKTNAYSFPVIRYQW